MVSACDLQSTHFTVLSKSLSAKSFFHATDVEGIAHSC